MSVSFMAALTPALISVLKDAGIVEELTTKNADGTYTHELRLVDREWPHIID